MGASGIAFLTPALLAGLAVVALPTLIHLISKRRARRVRFGPLELLLRSQRRTARSIRLRQLLLLLLRTLILLCVALAVARPVLRAAEVPLQTGAPLVVVVAVDTSASMSAVLDGRSMFDRARRKALEALEAQPEDVRTAAVACDATPRDLAGPTFDRATVAAAVSALEQAWGRADLVACVARAAGLAQSVDGEGERRVVVLSDLAAHGFPSGKPTDGEARGVVVEWVPAADGDPPPNHAITSVSLERVGGKSGEALEVGFSVSRFLGPEIDVPADLMVGARRAARLSLSLADGKSVKRSFHHVLSGDEKPDAGRLAVVLGDDAMSADNRVELPFELPTPLSVLVVDGAPQPVPFRDEVFYLESALRDARGGRSKVALEVIGADRLTPAAIAGARVVILANVARVDEAAASALVAHVKAGGGLFLTMGDQIDVEAYNRTLTELLPAPLRGTKGQALLDDASVAEILAFTRFRTEHPVLRGLSGGRADELVGLGRARTHTLMLLEPDRGASREVLMRFSNDAPALLERAVGSGRVLLLATTIDRDWSDLAIRPGFLPLVRQIVLYLGGSLDDGAPRLVQVGEPRAIRVDKGVEEIEVEPPRAARVRLRVEGGASEVLFRGTDAPGLYRVHARAAGGEARERPNERFTVVIDPAESDLTRASEEMLRQGTPAGAISRSARPHEGDEPLWPWLLLGAIVLLLSESVLLRRGSRQER